MTSFIDGDRTVGQMYWGGGTPNYLSLSQVEMLWNTLCNHFQFDENAEISIEVNPRSLNVTDNCTATFKDTPLNQSLIYLDLV
ncbi:MULTISPECIES: hypothetical protein [Nostoc]|uniref:hypothetical protein n=1 Tax=Nostoc TaxID=1177 RepID=UPI001F551AFB|nr:MULTISPECIES: hypothetical protein [Nostoc]